MKRFLLRLTILTGLAFLLLLLGASAQQARYGKHGPALLPDQRVTPGVVRTTSVKNVCTTKTTAVRDVTAAEKREVYAEYGVREKTGVCCEVDHLISLELGGSNDLKNLWPQPYSPQPAAREKDVVENELHREVCQGRMSLILAQTQIAQDWYGLYLQMQGTILKGKKKETKR